MSNLEQGKTRMEEVKQNIIDATSFREPKKVPVGADIFGWAFYFAETTYADTIDDPQKCADAFCRIFDEIPVDCTIGNTLWTAAMKVYNAVGLDQYHFSTDKTSVVHDQAGQEFMGPEIYDLIAKDPETYMNITYPKARYPIFSMPKEEAYKKFRNAAIENKKVNDTNALIADKLNAKGIYGLYDEGTMCYFSPFDYFFDYYRGIKDSLIDLRKRHDKVVAACDAIWESQKESRVFTEEEMKDPLPMGNFVYHSASFLPQKLYDELFFKYLMDGYGKAMEAGKKFHLYGQGGFIKTIERFRDTPKGSIVLKLDEDDPFEMYKKIGDWCTICAGVPIDLLQFGTKQECIDYVNKCFDTFAPGGGFMFFPSRVLMSGKDAKIENVIAVYQEADKLSRQ